MTLNALKEVLEIKEDELNLFGITGAYRRMGWRKMSGALDNENPKPRSEYEIFAEQLKSKLLAAANESKKLEADLASHPMVSKYYEGKTQGYYRSINIIDELLRKKKEGDKQE